MSGAKPTPVKPLSRSSSITPSRRPVGSRRSGLRVQKAVFHLRADEDILVKTIARSRVRGGSQMLVGTLLLTNQRVCFVHGSLSSGVSGTLLISVNLQEIDKVFDNAKDPKKPNSQVAKMRLKKKDHKDNEGYVFEFLSLNKLKEQEQDLVSPDEEDKWIQKAAFHEVLQSLSKTVKQPNAVSKSQAIEKKRRAALLARDRELKDVHDKVVIQSKVISEEEFWQSSERHRMLMGESTRQDIQQRGVPSAMITDVRPTTEVAANKVHYKLTPQVIHQIFVEYPRVLDVYEKYVPDRMTEEEFWVKYFQSRMFQRDRLKSKLQLPPDSNDIFKGADLDRHEKLSKKGEVDEFVDMTREEFVDRDGYGPASTVPMNKRKLEKSINLIRRYNRHSSLVVDGTSVTSSSRKRKSRQNRVKAQTEQASAIRTVEESAQNKRQRLIDMTQLEQLEDVVEEEVIPLLITDPKRYFESSEKVKQERFQDQSSEEFLKAVQTMDFAGVRCAVDEEVARSVMNELNAMDKKEDATKNTEGLAVPEAAKEIVNDMYATGCELLRHFWGSFPISSPKLQAKLDRLVAALEEHAEKMRRFMLNPSGREAVTYSVLQHLCSQINTALKHAQEVKKRRLERTALRRQQQAQQK